MNKVKDTLISVICPITGNESNLISYFNKLSVVISSNFEQYEIILVDDSNDNNIATEINSLIKQLDASRIIRLSRKFGIDIAITAGLDSCIGDYVVIMIPEQDPPEIAPQAILLSIKCNSVIVGNRSMNSRDSFIAGILRYMFYFVSNKILGLQLEKNTTFFAVLPRQAVTHVNKTKDKFRFLKTITAQIGLPIQRFEYQYASTINKRTFLESAGLSIDVIVTQSTKPLRLITISCTIISFLNLTYLAYILVVYLFKEHVAEGWPTLSLQISSGFFVLFFALAVFSEYISYLITESKNRPLYYVGEERNSTRTIANSETLNVLHQSTTEG